MLRKILKWSGVLLVALIALGVVLYAFGLRVVIYGGGSPHLQFVESERTRAERIARDREAQRQRAAAPVPSQAVEPAPATPPSTVATAPAAETTATPAATPSPALAGYWTDFRG